MQACSAWLKIDAPNQDFEEFENKGKETPSLN